MSQISNAVGSERVASVVGYELQKGNFAESTPNLPMRIAIFGQAATLNQVGLTNDPVEVTSEAEAGSLFGFGSQIHVMMRIIRSRLGDTTGGIPTIIYPQLAPGGAVAEEQEITVTAGPANKNGFLDIKINGRTTFDGQSLRVTVLSGETLTQIAAKITDVINNCTACPITATSALGVVTCVAKWVGVETGDLSVEIIVGNGDDLGMTYVVAQSVAGAGSATSLIQDSLDKFGNEWNTIVVNPYDKASSIPLFEAFNGIAGEVPATGRYSAITFKPFVCLVGNLIADTVANVITSLDLDETTIVQCPAPNSSGWNFEAAANVAALLARQAQDNPHLDVSGKTYPDMPVPDDQDAGIYTDYNDRDLLVKSGASTVIIVNSKYKVEDLVTTYHPVGENPPQFRYVRSLVQDWNMRFAYFLLEEINVLGKTIVQDSQPVSVDDVIKPDQWKAILFSMADDLARRALIVEPSFMTDSIEVGTSQINPDRFETSFKYKRSPYPRIASTTATAGFAFGI